ncbi:azaleucine resistance protein AzlC [Paenibacillus sp. M1]|uniref:Azaleucine resistance protein AzlC n=1 Tax=Paenibacillus haidiansis TaxID=1574488 RepID=A0ABU7VUS7_9BACL
MSNQNTKVLQLAFRSAFPSTIPILAGFLFLGIAYGIFMNVSGFGPVYAILMSLLIFAGSMEFVTVNLLLGAFNPLGALLLALMVNARHLFYGISMLEKYRGTGLKKIYLIFGMCDESFSINYTADIPKGVDKGWYMFFVTLLNHCYWVLGAAIGGIFGSFVGINMEGLEFVMTALFVVIFIEQWKKEKKHHSALIGLGISVLCLFIFGSGSFIVPSMIIILVVLSMIRKPLQQKTGESTCQ